MFYPFQNLSQIINVGTSSVATQLLSVGQQSPFPPDSYELQNQGAAPIYMAFGDATVTTSIPTATVGGGYLIQPGQSKLHFFGTGVTRPTHIACISTLGGQSFSITPGKGNE